MDASLLTIQPNAPEPIYRQIVEQLRRLIAGGQLAAGGLQQCDAGAHMRLRADRVADADAAGDDGTEHQGSGGKQSHGWMSLQGL